MHTGESDIREENLSLGGEKFSGPPIVSKASDIIRHWPSGSVVNRPVLGSLKVMGDGGPN